MIVVFELNIPIKVSNFFNCSITSLSSSFCVEAFVCFELSLSALLIDIPGLASSIFWVTSWCWFFNCWEFCCFLIINRSILVCGVNFCMILSYLFFCVLLDLSLGNVVYKVSINAIILELCFLSSLFFEENTRLTILAICSAATSLMNAARFFHRE